MMLNLLFISNISQTTVVNCRKKPKFKQTEHKILFFLSESEYLVSLAMQQQRGSGILLLLVVISQSNNIIIVIEITSSRQPLSK